MNPRPFNRLNELPAHQRRGVAAGALSETVRVGGPLLLVSGGAIAALIFLILTAITLTCGNFTGAAVCAAGVVGGALMVRAGSRGHRQ